MNIARRTLNAALGLVLSSSIALAKDPKELVIGTSAGPYADQFKLGIRPMLEKLADVGNMQSASVCSAAIVL
ncbi:hypothetical protein HSX11_08445 [Oxalobacteraceae bacterium]|nr:hypothetical protein [Oxalobacteraceae bacterium]